MKVYLNKKEIKKRLIRKNLSQNWLAFRLEITSGFMSQLMTGARHPSPKIRQRFMEHFSDCTFDDLFVIKGS
jgi:hypothetical protein